VALRIDHIGSTAVAGLAAKPIVDVQISVKRLEPVEPFRSPLEAAGFVHRAANTERTKRYFREPPGQRKLALAARFPHDRHGYLEAKLPIIWEVLRHAGGGPSRLDGRRRRARRTGLAAGRHPMSATATPRSS
jgi:hypothetical protein